MNLSTLLAASLPIFSATAIAGVKSGHAEASLLASSTTYQPGKPVAVGIRLTIDPGWHSYWINPGMGGMPLSAKWTLPQGWAAGDLGQPVPIRFMTGDLPGFGYEGEAVYRVDLTPPADAAGDVEVKVKLSWLTCSGDACVPGDVELTLKLPAGDAAPGPDAKAITAADAKIPRPAAGASATLAEKDGQIVFTVTTPADLDLSGARAFPATPGVLDPAAPMPVEKSPDGWVVRAPRDEYADGPVTACDLVISGGKLAHPLIVAARGL